VHGSLVLEVRVDDFGGGEKRSRDRARGMTRCRIRYFSLKARCRRQSVTIQATKSLGDRRENVMSDMVVCVQQKKKKRKEREYQYTYRYRHEINQ